MKEDQTKEDLLQKEKNHSLLLEDLYGIIQELLVRGEYPDGGDREFWLICLSKQHQLLLVERLNSRSLDEIYANEVFQIALHKRAVSVLLCQVNGDPTIELSTEECQMVRQLLRVGHLINLPILDYLTVNANGYHSLRQAGELDGLIKSNEPPLTVERAKALAQEAVENAKHALEASYYNEREEIAIHLFDEGFAISRIMSITDLSEVSLHTLLDNRK